MWAVQLLEESQETQETVKHRLPLKHHHRGGPTQSSWPGQWGQGSGARASSQVVFLVFPFVGAFEVGDSLELLLGYLPYIPPQHPCTCAKMHWHKAANP